MSALSEGNRQPTNDRSWKKVAKLSSDDRGEKAIRFLTTVFYIILFLFPFLLATVYASVMLFSDWTWLFPEHDKAFYFLPEFTGIFRAFLLCLSAVLISGLLIRLIWRDRKPENERSLLSKAGSVLIVLIVSVAVKTFLLNLFWEEVFPTNPYSDFAKTWARAIGDLSSLDYYSHFPGYINYSLIERWIASFTDSDFNAIVCFCVICNGITGVFVYLLTDEIFQKRSLAVFALLLYLINPSGMFYTLTTTPEHMSIACVTGSVFCICRYRNAERPGVKIIWLIAAGLLGGLGDTVKSFFPVILVAVVIVFVLDLLRKKPDRIWLRIGAACLSVLILFCLRTLVVNGITSLSEKEFEVELDYADATPHYLGVGLNRQGEGQIHLGEISRLYLQDRTDGIPMEEARENAIRRIKEDWRLHKGEVGSFLLKKTIWGWQDNAIPLRYFNTQLTIDYDSPLEKRVSDFVNGIGPSTLQVWYLLSMFFGMVGVIFVLKRRQTGINDLNFVFSNLMILGYFCLLLISESQSRYKCLIIPFLSTIDAYALFSIFDACRSLLKRKRFS